MIDRCAVLPRRVLRTDTITRTLFNRVCARIMNWQIYATVRTNEFFAVAVGS